jgi:hypothetical protein
MADYTVKQGDSFPIFVDTTNYTTALATLTTLTDATATLNLRALTSPAPLTLTGISAINNTIAAFTFTPTPADTAQPGTYMATWTITTATGGKLTLPTDGYLWINVEQNLSTAGGQQLVSLPEVKEHLNITSANRYTDTKLLRWIAGVRPVIEMVTGPIVVQQFDEWHDGGQLYIRLRHSPSTGYGASPVLTPIACSEYIVGVPVEWALAIVGTPDQGQMYSCQFDVRTGRVIRRTAGGAVQPFPAGPNTVHVVYQAGQQTVPANVTEGTLELLRENYRETQAVGHGAQAQADVDDTGPPKGYYISKHVRELLAPNRKHPAVA